MDDNELRKTLRAADTKKSFPALNEMVVASGPLSKPRRSVSFKAARWSLAGVAASAVAVSLAIPQISGPQPLFEMAGGGSSLATGTKSGAAEVASDAAASSTMDMIWPGWIEYTHIADGLDDQPGRGEIFEVRKSGDPQALLATLADIFDVAGTPTKDEWASNEYPSYSINSDNSSLSTWWYGAAGWNFGRWSSDWGGCMDPALPETAAGSTGEEPTEGSLRREDSDIGCEPKPFVPTPELIPSESEMLAIAQELFGQLKMPLDYSLARSWRDDWGGSISIPLSWEGQPIPLDAYLGWDSAGQISYASGYSIEIVSRGKFDTISPSAAVERISDWRWYGGAPSYLYERLYDENSSGARSEFATGVAESTGADDAAVEGGQEPQTKPAPDVDMPVDPLPGEGEQMEPEIVELKVNRAETALLSLYDSAGNMWLVPGYLLYNDQGWFDSIVSVVEGVIALPEPMDDVMPMIDEPAVEPVG